MKNSFIYLIIFFSVTLIYGCNKNKPKPGMYTAEFYYTIPEHWDTITEWYVIKEVGKDYIEVSFSTYGNTLTTTLQKSNKKIMGKLMSSTNSPRLINGTWEKKKGTYIIKGNFTQTGYNPVGPAETLSGTFELKSDH